MKSKIRIFILIFIFSPVFLITLNNTAVAEFATSFQGFTGYYGPVQIYPDANRPYMYCMTTDKVYIYSSKNAQTVTYLSVQNPLDMNILDDRDTIYILTDNEIKAFDASLFVMLDYSGTVPSGARDSLESNYTDKFYIGAPTPVEYDVALDTSTNFDLQGEAALSSTINLRYIPSKDIVIVQDSYYQIHLFENISGTYTRTATIDRMDFLPDGFSNVSIYDMEVDSNGDAYVLCRANDSDYNYEIVIYKISLPAMTYEAYYTSETNKDYSSITSAYEFCISNDGKYFFFLNFYNYYQPRVFILRLSDFTITDEVLIQLDDYSVASANKDDFMQLPTNQIVFPTDALYEGGTSGVCIIEFDGYGTDGTIAPQAPILKTPIDGAALTGQTIFKWEEPYTTIGLGNYEIQFAYDENFSDLAYSTTSQANSLTPETLTNGLYYWRVRVADTLARNSEWSDIYSFTIEIDPFEISEGNYNPLSSYQLQGVQDLPTLQFLISANSVTTSITSLTFHVNGTLNDVIGIESVDLYVDKDNDGKIDVTDTKLNLSEKKFSVDNGSVVFTGSPLRVIDSGGKENYLVAVNLYENADLSTTFQISFDDSDVIAEITSSGDPISPSLFEIAGGTMTLSDTAGANANLNVVAGESFFTGTKVIAGQKKVPLLQLKIEGDDNVDAEINEISFHTGGTFADTVDVLAANIYWDKNSNGYIDTGDSQLNKDDGLITENDGDITFTGAPILTVPANVDLYLIFAVDINSATSSSKTFYATFDDLRDISGVAKTTDEPAYFYVAESIVSSTIVVEAPQISPSKGKLPLDAQFYANYDSAILYEWDFSYNGKTFETQYLSTDTGETTFTYQLEGTYRPVLRVTFDTMLQVLYDDFEIEAAEKIPPDITVFPSITSGIKPLDVDFTPVALDDDGYVVKYEWDFDGDGVFDEELEAGDKVSYQYTEGDVYYPVCKVTDEDGLTDEYKFKIKVFNSTDEMVGDSSSLGINATPLEGSAPLTLTFNPVLPSEITDPEYYAWDFDGDGNYDKISMDNSAVVNVYNFPGEYYPKLLLITASGDRYDANILVKITAGENPPLINVSTTDVSIGEFPLDVNFTAAAVDNSKIVLYEWDVNGDNIVDYEGSNLNELEYIFSNPGQYYPMLSVTDDMGLKVKRSFSIIVLGNNSTTAFIQYPSNGSKFYGDYIPLTGKIIPYNANNEGSFYYRASGSDSWISIANSLAWNQYVYSYDWNISSLTAGNYELLFKGIDSSGNEVSDEIEFIISSDSDNETLSWTNESDALVISKTLDPEEFTSITLQDKERVIIPAGAVDLAEGETSAPIDIKKLKTISNDANGDVQYLEFIGKAYDITLSYEKLNKPITLIIPYDDYDSNGYIDSNSTYFEPTIIPAWYDTTEQKWKLPLSYEVDTVNNEIRIDVYHLSEYAIFSDLLSETQGDTEIVNPDSLSNLDDLRPKGTTSCFISRIFR